MNITNTIAGIITTLREKSPLVHNITNYVTVNDCANVILAIGGSPIMADDIAEAGDIASIASALVINIGTLNERTIKSMILAGESANKNNVPVILDPVGAGASNLRNMALACILDKVKIAVIRGNLSEIAFIAGAATNVKGVDSIDNANDPTVVAKIVSKKYDCVVAITGEVDTICEQDKILKISNGHKMLSKVTGTGCMLTAIVGAFCGASSNYFLATAGAVASMGIAGEIAYKNSGLLGSGSFHISIIDALSNMTQELFAHYAHIN